MDPRTFDRLVAEAVRRPTRRATLRVLAGGLLGGLLAPRLARAALQADRDQDGLYDDDEGQVYGTNPDISDTDGDGVGDGEEVYYGRNPVASDGLGGEQGEAVACADDLVNCNGACVNPAFDLLHCGYCGNACTGGNGYVPVCSFGVCGLTAGPPAGSVAIGDVNDGCDPGPNPPGCYCVVNGQCVIADSGPITCREIGTPCNYDSQCCDNPSVHCCFDGTYLRIQCTDVSVYGNVCPG
jgi:hypothetical protein